ncbi:MAG TPA: L-seryl-tRNA(Sec) selenium transferase, partial [bacterium]|nr:L-seryl-tRNA(Sec) selenium transferase [bacterium]
METACGYSNLEFNLDTGSRGKRTDHVCGILSELTGAEAAIAVNNNAGAVLLTLAALAQDREVIVSRGELVEIGGGFRVPEVMAASRAVLKEVGTTNRTHLKDYTGAISDTTALIMKAHQSNFGIVGFTSDVPLIDLVNLGHAHHIPVIYDLGSGSFFDGRSFGWHSPVVKEQIAAGVDIVTFSGDKVLGGPQAGIIAGRKELIDVIAAHPLARALRLDKMTLAALDTTLRLYLSPDSVREHIPALRALTLPLDRLKSVAEEISHHLQRILPSSFTVAVVAEKSTPGGGSMPLIELDTWAISIVSEILDAAELARRLRRSRPPVVARIQKDVVLLDPRTVQPWEINDLIRSFRSAFYDEINAERPPLKSPDTAP